MILEPRLSPRVVLTMVAHDIFMRHNWCWAVLAQATTKRAAIEDSGDVVWWREVEKLAGEEWSVDYLGIAQWSQQDVSRVGEEPIVIVRRAMLCAVLHYVACAMCAMQWELHKHDCSCWCQGFHGCEH